MPISSFAVLAASLLFVSGARAQEPAAPSQEERIKDLELRLEKLETKPANASISSFNPAMGMALDTVLRDANDKANFDFRSAELNLEAAVDPFAKGWAVITGSNGGVDVEEAAAQTTALPYNLTVRGGRVFAPFGRFSMWHDHELPMVYRPNSLNLFVGAESQADGLDVNYLFPTPFYLEGYVGAYNKIGDSNTRADNSEARPFDRFTYLARLHGYGDLGDSFGLDMGASEAWTPKQSVVDSAVGAPLPLNGSGRFLSGVDLTLRYTPAAGGLYHGFVWTTEALQNSERQIDPLLGGATTRLPAYAGYTNFETKLGRVTRLGAFADLTQLPFDRKKVVQTYAAYLTFEVTEFNRIRLQYSRTIANFTDAVTGIAGTDFASGDLFALHRGHMVAVQWTCVIGWHVHGFRGRWGA
jgi:hypothetical protein